MKPMFWTLVALMLALPAQAAFQSDSTVTVTGQMSVQAFYPQAQMVVEMSTADAYALKVSSPGSQPLAVLDGRGRLGVATYNPAAHLDIPGAGDNGTVGMWLRSGNSSMTALSSQIVFGEAGSAAFRHSIASQHVASQNLGNSLDFFLWNSTGHPTVLGSQEVMSLQAISTASYVSVHVDPYGNPEVELEVSNGQVTGGGTIERANAEAPSSRAFKSDIRYLTAPEEEQAFNDVMSLKHVRFRYKTHTAHARLEPLRRGLIYEDAPASIHGPGKSVMLDDRLANLEMALKVIDQRVAALQAQVDLLEKQKMLKKRGKNQ